MGEPHRLRHAAGVVDVAPRAAGPLLRQSRAVVVELQGDAHDVEPLRGQQGGHGRAVDAARHRHDDPRLGGRLVEPEPVARGEDTVGHDAFSFNYTGMRNECAAVFPVCFTRDKGAPAMVPPVDKLGLAIMYLKKVEGARTALLPNGRIITRADLPSPGTRRWVASRKAAVVAGVEAGLVTRDWAIATYGLSGEELDSWLDLSRSHGAHGLRTTALKRYRQP